MTVVIRVPIQVNLLVNGLSCSNLLRVIHGPGYDSYNEHKRTKWNVLLRHFSQG